MSINELMLSGMDSTSVAVDLVPIVPNDSVDLPETARAIRCKPTGAAGTVRFVSWRGELRNTSIEAGGELRVAALRVHATGTTATDLEAMI
jgi:hypothetical protein